MGSGAVPVDDPEVRPPAVFHDVHERSRLDDPLTIGGDLGIGSVNQPENIFHLKWPLFRRSGISGPRDEKETQEENTNGLTYVQGPPYAMNGVVPGDCLGMIKRSARRYQIQMV